MFLLPCSDSLISCPYEPDRFEWVFLFICFSLNFLFSVCFCFISVCVLCVWGCVCVIGMQMYVQWPEGDLQISSFIAFYLSLQWGCLTKPPNLEISVWLSWLANGDLGSSCLHFPRAGNADVGHVPWLLTWALEIHICVLMLVWQYISSHDNQLQLRT